MTEYLIRVAFSLRAFDSLTIEADTDAEAIKKAKGAAKSTMESATFPEHIDMDERRQGIIAWIDRFSQPVGRTQVAEGVAFKDDRRPHRRMGRRCPPRDDRGGTMIRRFLDASIGHLSPETWAWLDEQFSDAVLRDPLNDVAAQVAGGKTQYGWLVYAPEGVAEGLPDDLTAILLKSRELGAEYVLFDRDAPPASDLPILHPDFLDGSDPA